jgi:hypothetical protein
VKRTREWNGGGSETKADVPAAKEAGACRSARRAFYKLWCECGPVRRNEVKAEEKLFGQGEITELIELTNRLAA